MNKLSIIMPVFNEEKTIVKILDKLSKVKFRVDFEIIIVDDGSSDSSSKIIKEYIKNSKKA